MKSRGAPAKVKAAAARVDKRGGIPASAAQTIKDMESAAREGVQAGATGDPRNPATQPGTQRQNIPGGNDIVAPPGYNAP
jgi:hypothetical protein